MKTNEIYFFSIFTKTCKIQKLGIKMIDKNNDLFKNKYKIESTRLKTWDYSWNGCYFVTICTKDKYNFFGNIDNGVMNLNKTGEIAKRFWLEIPEHFSNVELDEFVIMPNHVHGILAIKNNDKFRIKHKNEPNNTVETLQCNVSNVLENESNDNQRNKFFSEISPKHESISTIIRSYKSICTKTINKMQSEICFAWQTRFHDSLIRDDESLKNIRKYIIDNPLKWENDSYYFKTNK